MHKSSFKMFLVLTGVAETAVDAASNVAAKASDEITNTFKNAWNLTNNIARLGAQVCAQGIW